MIHRFSKKSSIPIAMAVFVGAALMVACGGSGGGGSSPTEPVQYVRVAGVWEGVWVPPVTVTMELQQSGPNVTGQLDSLGFVFDITGTASVRSTGGGGTLEWQVVGGGCGNWTGAMNVNAAEDGMAGPSRLSTVGCSDPTVIEDTLNLRRVGTAAVTSKIGRSGLLVELVRALR